MADGTMQGREPLVIRRARAKLGERPAVSDTAHDTVSEQVWDAAAFVLAAAQPGARWTCSLGHRHKRPEALHLRPLTHQAERLWDAAQAEWRLGYSGSIWSLAVFKLIDLGLLSEPSPGFGFDVTEAGRVA